jgi:hypothetical protein
LLQAITEAAALHLQGCGFLYVHILMSCHEKDPLACHAERREASGLTRGGGVAHMDASLPLSMTREGAFVMAMP